MPERKVILNWIPVFLWMGLIWYFSSRTGPASTEQSQTIVKIVSSMLSGLIPYMNISDSIIEHIVRKTAHVFEYFILGLLVFRAFSYSIKKYSGIIAGTLTLCISYSVLDEIHQLFRTGRMASIKDVLIDSCGIILAVLISHIIFKKKSMA